MKMPNRVIAAAAVSTLALGSLLARPAPAHAAGHTPVPPTSATLTRQADKVVAAGVPGVTIETRDQYGTRTITTGVGNVRSTAPPRADGRFRIGSVTKTFTATLVLSLAADGLIRLDAPIDDYLPGLLPYPEPITVRQLLQHRSGLFDYGNVLWASPRLVAQSRYRDYAPPDLISIATEQPLQSTPGRQFGYSNTDYIVLGMLVEKVTGHHFSHELAQRVLRPARLHHTYLAGHDPRLRKPAARGYEAVRPRRPLTDLTTYDMSVAWTSGAIVSTTHDLNRFYTALLNGHLLPRTLLRQMEQTRPAFPGFDYGLGLAHATMCGHSVWGHVGGVPGYGTYSFTSPRSARQITVSVNRSLTLSTAADAAVNALVETEFCG